jgi:phosphoglycolate phosphatase
MQTKHKLIIWDWNGTLLNDVWLSVAAINTVLKRYNLPTLSTTSYKSVFDFPVKDYYQRIGFDFSKDTFEKVGTEFIDLYNAQVPECSLQAGTLETIQKLRNAGFQQVVLSARKEEQLKTDLENFGLLPYLEAYSGLADHYENSKTDNGHTLLRSMGIEASQATLIGDTLHDAEVAKQLGCNCILFDGGHQSHQKLRTANTTIIHQLNQLNQLLNC